MNMSKFILDQHAKVERFYSEGVQPSGELLPWRGQGLNCSDQDLPPIGTDPALILRLKELELELQRQVEIEAEKPVTLRQLELEAGSAGQTGICDC
ncbi:hypothetical protein SRHO_G00207120 [Serrasalmus rhombeus]